MKPNAKLLSTGDVALILRLSPDMVRHIANAGGLKTVRTKGGVRIFNRADVERLRLKRMSQR